MKDKSKNLEDVVCVNLQQMNIFYCLVPVGVTGTGADPSYIVSTLHGSLVHHRAIYKDTQPFTRTLSTQPDCMFLDCG